MLAKITATACLMVFASAAFSAERYTDWWPSEWGPEDELGAANHLSSDNVLRAAKLIREGKVYDLGRVFEDSMPLLSNAGHPRKFSLFSLGAPLYGPMGNNRLIWNEDYISGHLTQAGTQFDSLAHMGVAVGDLSDKRNARYYNGFSHADIGSAHGFTKLGTESVPPIFTKGILLDFTKLKGRSLRSGEAIDVDDIRQVLRTQQLTADAIGSGDAVLLNTGWGQLWGMDNEEYNSGKPGLSMEAGDWLAEKGIVILGTDNWGLDPTPGVVEGTVGPVHQKYMVKFGIYIIENMDLSALARNEVYEFAFSVSPIQLKGATGAPVRPIAIR